MSEISHNVDKKLVLATGRAHPQLAEEVAKALDTELLPLNAYDFANGEIYVRSDESVRGKDVFLMQSYPAPLNNWLMEQLIMIDSMKRASAQRITVVAPFYPYARQDKKGRGREPISARLVADLFKPPARTASSPATCTPRRSRASSTVRLTTSSLSRCWPTTSATSSRMTRSPWFPRTPDACAWQSSGPNAWAAPRWRSCTSPAI